MPISQIEWTEERVDLVKRRWSEGATGSQIATEIGTTRNSIIGKINRLGLRRTAPRENLNKGGGAYQQRNRNRKPKAAPAILTVIGKPKAAPMPKGAKPPVVRAPAKSLRLTFADLEPRTCRFPEGDGPFFFCGQPTKPGKSYCPSCEANAYRVAPKPPSRAEQALRRAMERSKPEVRAFR
ncbi:MAG TPA: GcrA family cell cycle regulator [Xanthobacteraceae bacterium]|nr:GcrA family cell cycle regulator [Xanthobacteraceae bacterium]